MELAHKKKILELLESDDQDSLFIDPLLDIGQVGNVTVDLRLGYDFFVSTFTRKSFIELSKEQEGRFRGISSYFQDTRRDIGDRFILYPSQVVLTTTLEYLSLPPNIYLDVLSRSSYTRLGIHVNTMVQPGFRGSVPLELFNHGNNSIELIVGSRICQVRLFEIDNETEYLNGNEKRKYFGDVRPTLSMADEDKELAKLTKIFKVDL